MKLTYKQIQNSIPSLNELIDKELPYKTALCISRNVAVLNEKLQEYETEYYKLADKYIERDNDGHFVHVDNGYKIVDGQAEKYKEDLKTLEDFEVDVALYPLTEEMFGDVSIKPSLLMNIDFMICDE